jgi:hypothetical protein
MRRLLIVALVFAVAVVALSRPAGAQRQDPVAFLSQTLRLIAANRYAEAWQTLHPLDRAVAPLDAYVRCEALSPIPGRLASLRVLDVRRELVRIAPRAARQPSVAVRFRLTIAGAAVPAGVVVTPTVHAVAVDGGWAWILPLRRFELYRTNGCLPPTPGL